MFDALNKYLFKPIITSIKFIFGGLIHSIYIVFRTAFEFIYLFVIKYLILVFKFLIVALGKLLYYIIISVFKSVTYILAALKYIILKLANYLIATISWLYYLVFKVVGSIVLIIYYFFKYIFKGFYYVLGELIVTNIVRLFRKIGVGLKNFFKKVGNAFKKLKENLKSTFEKKSYTGELVDIDVDKARSSKKIIYQYVVRDQNGKIIKDTISSTNVNEVQSFLLSEGYEIISVTTSPLIRLLNRDVSAENFRFGYRDLSIFLTNLATMLKTTIPLIEAMKIAAMQTKKKVEQKIFKEIIYDISMGFAFSEALERRGQVFPILLINMVKAAEATGDLANIIEQMAEYYEASYKTRKQLISTMIYPSIVFSLTIGITAFIMVAVVPSFVDMFDQFGSDLPLITRFVINVSKFLTSNGFILLLILVVLIIFIRFLYKKVKPARYRIQWILMHIPIIKNVLIYSEVAMFTRSFGTLFNSSVYMKEIMRLLDGITQNEIFRKIIAKTIYNIENGKTISIAFENHWAFPEIAHAMLRVGEATGQLGDMMLKVADYYENEQVVAISRVKTLIEPALISLLALIVGTIVISILLPMFSIYGQINT